MKKKRGTYTGLEDENGRQYIRLLDGLKMYSDPLKIKSINSNNRVSEMCALMNAAYERLRDQMADDVVEVPRKTFK